MFESIFEHILSAVLTGLSLSIPMYVIAKHTLKNAKKEIITTLFDMANDENVQKLAYKYGFMFANGAAQAVPMLKGLKGGKLKIEDIAMQALGSLFGKGNPLGNNQEQPQGSNTSEDMSFG